MSEYDNKKIEELKRHMEDQRNKKDEFENTSSISFEIKELIPIHSLQDELFEGIESENIATAKLLAAYGGFNTTVPFTKYGKNHRQPVSRGSAKKRFVCELERVADKINKYSNDATTTIKQIIIRCGDPEVRPATSKSTEMKYFTLSKIENKLDEMMSDDGVENTDTPLDNESDTTKKSEKLVDENCRQSVEKMRRNDKGLYPKLECDPHASSFTSAEKFESPSMCSPASLDRIHKDMGIPKAVSDEFISRYDDELTEARRLVKEAYEENEDLFNVEVDPIARHLEKKFQEEYGLSIDDGVAFEMNSSFEALSFYMLKLFLIMGNDEQQKWIHNLSFSHLTITKNDALRFIVRVFMRMREVNGGYCGIDKFKDKAFFLKMTQEMTAGRDFETGYKEISVESADDGVIKQMDHIYNCLCKYSLLAAQRSATLTDYDRSKMTNYVNVKNAAGGFADYLENIKNGEIEHASALLHSISLVHPTTGKNISNSIHTKPLIDSVLLADKKTRIQLLADSAAVDVIRTPVFSLNMELRSANQKFGGIELGDIFTFASQSGGGKSFWSWEFAKQAYMDGRVVLYLTLETKRDTVLKRATTQFNPYGVYDEDRLLDHQKRYGIVESFSGNLYIRDCIDNIDDKEIQARQIASYTTMVKSLQVFTKERPGDLIIDPVDNEMANTNIIQDKVKAYEAQYKRKVDFIVIDSALQLTTNKNHRNFQHFDVARTAIEELHTFTAKNKVAVFMTHQMNAGGNKKVSRNTRPSENDMSATLNVLQKSSVVVVNFVSDTHDQYGCGELILRKSRHGRKGAIIHYMRDLQNGVGFLPYSDRYIGNGDKDEKAMKAQKRRYFDV